MKFIKYINEQKHIFGKLFKIDKIKSNMFLVFFGLI